MEFLSLLESKRDGFALSTSQIDWLVRQFSAGTIPDYQVSAFLMASYLQGMSREETRTLTLAMRDSGETLEFPADPRPVVDKHSTGGVGDKVSLPLTPLLACLGFRVPMISGRGLGITGGTLDKLESIPGFRSRLGREEIIRQVQEVGCVICGQTDKMVPADKRLYALRDVTATVPSIALITSSILSKKLAEGLDLLLLDVKFGRAAFMPSVDQARALAAMMVFLGNECGVGTRALLTDMNQPLGRAVGNWIEVKESAGCLECRGPASLEHLVLECAAHLLHQAGKATDVEAGRIQAATCLASGLPKEKWEQMLAAQGVDIIAYQRKLLSDTCAPFVEDIYAVKDGFVAGIDARVIGEEVRRLGGGRAVMDAEVDPDVGLDELVVVGEAVGPGYLLGRVHSATRDAAQRVATNVRDALHWSDEPVLLNDPVYEVILG
ncbi:MAG: thymidine phosphorylase [Opitutaceae bacterium]|nr:thymidine phosphorylase [Verrucomicrobiales bacterium]